MNLADRTARMRGRMDSTCTLRRDVSGVDDDTIDPTTLGLVKPVGDETTIYTGPCFVLKPEFISDAQGGYGGGRDDERPSQVIAFPGDAPAPIKDDIVTVDSCPDPALVGVKFKITRVEHNEFMVTRKCPVVKL